MLECVDGNSETKLEFRFHSGIILTFLSMIDDELKYGNYIVHPGIDNGDCIINELYFYYLALVLAVHAVDENISIENLFIEKLEASTLAAMGTNEIELADTLRLSEENLPLQNAYDFSIGVLNMTNIASVLVLTYFVVIFKLC